VTGGSAEFSGKENLKQPGFCEFAGGEKIRHEYRQLPGAHNWKYWNAQIQEFLELSNESINRSDMK
jgi:S-formylglutathione hydrolase FrmB